jgi:hypothetical protein
MAKRKQTIQSSPTNRNVEPKRMVRFVVNFSEGFPLPSYLVMSTQLPFDAFGQDPEYNSEFQIRFVDTGKIQQLREWIDSGETVDITIQQFIGEGTDSAEVWEMKECCFSEYGEISYMLPYYAEDCTEICYIQVPFVVQAKNIKIQSPK